MCEFEYFQFLQYTPKFYEYLLIKIRENRRKADVKNIIHGNINLHFCHNIKDCYKALKGRFEGTPYPESQ